ncbi:MAG: metal-dependent hydrolase [Acidobacteria bacterium]|nr:MAG: metal-dependent hydrolase [Acidobacteriota bacterium]
MDNLTHSLVAVSLGRVGLREKIPGGTLSLIAAANLADLDVVSSFWGHLYYLTYHRGFSHSIAGTLVLAALLTVFLWLVGRSRGHPASLGQISLAVFGTAATHPLLDLTNSYGVRPFLPFLERWYYGDLVFIVDPYLWLILGGAVFLTGQWSRPGKAAWAAVAALGSLILVLAARSFGLWIPLAIWLAGVGAILFAKKRQIVFPGSLAAFALAAVVIYWGFLGAIHWLTLREVYPEVQARYPGIGRDAVSVTPRPANPFQWDLFIETPDEVGYGRAFSFSSQSSRFEMIPRNQDNPVAAAAASTCPGAVFTRFARFPVFDVSEAKGGAVVTIEDVRFTRQGRNPRFGSITIRLDSADAIPCPDVGVEPKTAPHLQTNKKLIQ